MDAFAPLRVGRTDTPRRVTRNWQDLHAEVFDQPQQMRAHIAPRRNDKRFGNRASRHDHAFVGLKRRRAGIPASFLEKDCHQCGSVDGDHFGNPCSS
jgi:hypothetical protein